MQCECDMDARYTLKDAARQNLRSHVRAKKEAERNHRPWLSGERAREELEEELQSSWSQPRCRLFMHDFEKHKRTNEEWRSEPFYQAPRWPNPNGSARYKLQLGVYANGCSEARGNMAVFVYLLEGESDDKLHWPVKIETTIQLRDQSEGKRAPTHITSTIVLESSESTRSCEVKQKKLKKIRGVGRELKFAVYGPPTSSAEYLKNDTIQFEITTVTTYKL